MRQRPGVVVALALLSLLGCSAPPAQRVDPNDARLLQADKDGATLRITAPRGA